MFRGAKKRTFRFGKKNVSFPKVETFRFADYISNYNISPLALSRCVLVVTIILLTSLWRIYGVLERG